MNISNKEILNVLQNLNEIFDKNNCEHLQLLLYLIYNYHHIDDAIDSIIDQLILQTKDFDICQQSSQQYCNIIDISHPYPLRDKLNDQFISERFESFYNLNTCKGE